MVHLLPAPRLLLIILSLGCLVATQLQTSSAAILRPLSDQQQHRLHHLERPPRPAPTPQPISILLTTGEQVKLHQTAWQANTNRWHLTGNSLVVKTTDTLTTVANQLNRTHVDAFGNNSYTRWLDEKTSNVNLTGAPSIVPGRAHQEAELFESTKSGWRKPWITDVDYFINGRFCGDFFHNSSFLENQCLVIVWLDKANNFVHYGSILLEEGQQLFHVNASASHHKTRFVTLLEFPPIDVFKGVQLSDNFPAEINSFAVDKRRLKLHVTFSDGSAPYATRLLSGTFRDYVQAFMQLRFSIETLTGLEYSNLYLFNDNCKGLDFTPIEGPINLSVDETTGEWLFYLDKTDGGRILAFGLDDRWISKNALISDSIKLEESIPFHAHVLDLHSSHTGYEPQDATCMGFDHYKQRIYWLTETNTLYSCNLAGKDVRKLDKLSSRPNLRSPSSLQIHENTLFISDPKRRALLTYMIDDRSKEETSNANVEVPNHEVVLLEMPTIMGFRVLSLSSGPPIWSNSENESNITSVSSNGNESEIKVVRSKSLLDGILALFDEERDVDGKNVNYAYELTSRTSAYNHCAFKQLDRICFFKGFNITFLYMEVIIIQIAICIWLFLPWLKQKLGKSCSDEIVTDSSKSSI